MYKVETMNSYRQSLRLSSRSCKSHSKLPCIPLGDTDTSKRELPMLVKLWTGDTLRGSNNVLDEVFFNSLVDSRNSDFLPGRAKRLGFVTFWRVLFWESFFGEVFNRDNACMDDWVEDSAMFELNFSWDSNSSRPDFVSGSIWLRGRSNKFPVDEDDNTSCGFITSIDRGSFPLLWLS